MINYSNILVKNGLTYQAYRDLVDEKLKTGKTTGEDNSEAMLHYSKMNVHRMSRLDKSIKLTDEFSNVLAGIKNKYNLLVITEGWCGDAAQIVPLFNKIVQAAPAHFQLRLVLRDQYPDLIDQHLTNGGRAIPVLLILDENGVLLNKWGPRPALLSPLLADWRRENEDMMAVAEKLHGWYAKDKTLSTQKELMELFRALT
ncbi:thioredoxin family protein [Pedobacter sp.]|uniref:thioredoxin family protein n=1 Tax=Pedobacter sp. TaxID=1411316 RepID=UPI003D7FBDCF